MNLKDILKNCLDYINENTENNGGEQGFKSSELGKKLKNCANTCYSILYSTYGRMIVRENILTLNQELYYTFFQKRVNRIIAVKKNGFRIPFKITESGLLFDEDGYFEVEYTYFPDELDFNDEVVLVDNVSPACFTYMVVSEYWLREGDLERSNVFYEKFLSSKQNRGRVESKNWKVQKWLR